MLIRYEDLTSLRMQPADGTSHAIEDICVTGPDLRASHAVVDVGGWFSGRTALVGLDRLGTPDVAGSRWPTSLAEQDLEAGAGVPAGRAGQAAEARGTIDDPETAIGPKDAGVLESAAGAMMRVREAGECAAGSAAEGEPRSVARMIDGTTVAAEDGEVGSLMGLIFDTDDWRARYLIISTGKGALGENQRVVPAGLVASAGWEGGPIALSCPAERVHSSPDLHEMDGLEGKWFNRVLAYYGLQS